MKTVFSVVSLLLLSTFASAAGTSGVEKAVADKMAAIKASSAECYESVALYAHGDLTALRFLSVIALNSTASIQKDLAQIKSEVGSDCPMYESKVDAYIKANDKQLEATMNGLEACASSAVELKEAVETLVESGKDLTDLYVELKSVDYSKPAACADAHKKILDYKARSN